MVEANKNHTQLQINSILKEGQDSFKLSSVSLFCVADFLEMWYNLLYGKDYHYSNC